MAGMSESGAEVALISHGYPPRPWKEDCGGVVVRGAKAGGAGSGGLAGFEPRRQAQAAGRPSMASRPVSTTSLVSLTR